MSGIDTAGAILAMIYRDDGPFLPTDNQMPSTTDVKPLHKFEADWETGRLRLNIVQTTQDRKKQREGSAGFRMEGAKPFLKKAAPDLDFTVLSIVR